MNLFTQVVEDDKLHPNYTSLIEHATQDDLKLLESWTDGFPDRDHKFCKEFQTTFNSSFWEIYLYKLFKELDFNFDWGYNRPDFILEKNGTEFIVEATISSNAQDSIPEWEKNPDILKRYEGYLDSMHTRNILSIIRLSNSFESKRKKYGDYQKLDHVKNKPFVLALAPFEQPLHYHQYDRPIMALLYDHYVNEELSFTDPERYPTPPTQNLGTVTKSTGAEIQLGLFLSEIASDVSAVLFNPIATFSKVQNMNDKKMGATLLM